MSQYGAGKVVSHDRFWVDFTYAVDLFSDGQGAMLKIKGMRFPKEIILMCIRWYAAYALSYRNFEEMMQERGVLVDHSTFNWWAIRFLPLLENIFSRHKRPVGGSWRMDETYIKVRGQWKYLYRAVDKEGRTIDFLMTAVRFHPAFTATVFASPRIPGLLGIR